tara:strand:- start:163 stop:318 length:156 start_codon:yes stop_codon:yes gene_type:complete
MGKQEVKKEDTFEERVKNALETLKAQQEDTKVIWTKCQGAIEVLENLISEA